MGQVEDINDWDNTVVINFLIKGSHNDLFYWPQVQDKADVQPNVIFNPNAKVVKDGRRFKVLNLEDLTAAYKKFAQKYFSESIQ